MAEHKPGNRQVAGKPKGKNKNKKKKGKTILMWFFITAAIAIFCALAGYLFIILSGEKIYKENIDKLTLSESSIIYDSSDKAVKKLVADQIDRELVSLNQIPEKLRYAFIATEDKRFEQHQGVDLWALGRAVVRDVISRSAKEGGSTITQQLAKNLFLNADKTYLRKATEVSIALALENNLTKDQILEKYLNRIYFGKSAYGVKAAAKRYFGKNLEDIEVAEMAILAAIPKAPSNYNPIDNPERSLERRKVVLQLMYEQGYITAAEKEEAFAYEYKPIPKQSGDVYTSYMDYVIKEAAQVTGLTEEEIYTKGLRIFTNLNTQAQKAAESAFSNDDLFPEDGKTAEGKPYQVQGGMTIVNNLNGGIVAMVGGRDVNAGDLNRATVKRQPGSSFKPVTVYGPALDSGDWTPYSSLNNQKQCFGDYCPRNLGGYSDSVPLIDAVEDSINIPAVWLLNEMGAKSGYNFAKKLGLPLADTDRNLSIALGGLTNGVSTLDMAQAYTAFANQGRLNKAHAIRSIKDSAGRDIYSMGKLEQKQVMSPQTAYTMTQLMENVVQNGSGKRAQMNRPVAGKTGTAGYKGTKGNQDIWFAGYTPEWTAAVYMGFDRTTKDNYLDVSSGATARMFSEVMEKALSGRPVKDFVRPEGVVDIAQPPSSVKDLAASYSPEENSVTLTWSPKEGEVAYQVYRKEANDAGFNLIQTVNDAGAVDVGITPGSNYQYYVIVSKQNGNLLSKQSNWVQVAVTGVVTPPEVVPTEPGDGNVIDPGEGPEIEIPDGDDGGENPEEPQNPDEGTVPDAGDGTGNPDNGTEPPGENPGDGQENPNPDGEDGEPVVPGNTDGNQEGDSEPTGDSGQQQLQNGNGLAADPSKDRGKGKDKDKDNN
ncbi:hypothetical protein SY83_18065 [Paenibacillus swuensis]|uniref:Fibronectin type-III domain-containing protein n=1 Tax=Paenibacillus swuensis TaxID=1178515 RepID=A0A172TM72_9BACL|nr:PBP1A family penicillin-binding protein [Paenibacillus swuensis]ANE47883.1 hypothetical protein SY83_18065 [Paenibacillus swuensis]